MKPKHITVLWICWCLTCATVVCGQGITVTGGAKLQLKGAVHLKVTGSEGNVATNNNGDINLEAQSSLSLSGDLNLNGTNTQLLGSLLIVGNQSQSISANEEITVSNLNMSNSAGLILQAPVLVMGSLTLSNGIITTNTNNVLTLGERDSFGGGGESSYVNGALAINSAASIGEHSFSFPIGNGTTYKPITLSFSQTNASSTTYTAQMNTTGIPDLDFPVGLEGVSPSRYWQISNGGVSNFTDAVITLPVTPDDGVDVATNVRIAKSNGSAWQNLGGTATAIPGTISSTEAFATLGNFIIASLEIVIPPPTIATNDGIIVNQGESAIVSQTVLELTDQNSGPEGIIFTLITPPVNGTLQKDAQALAANETFTQADINADIITYVHAGGNNINDSFTFSASNEAGGTTSETPVAITISLPNIPTANAGPDQTVIDEDDNGNEDITLDGSASLNATSYTWEWDGGSTTGVNPTVTLPLGSTTITLTVSNEQGNDDSDEVIVTVNAFVDPGEDLAPPQIVSASFNNPASHDQSGSLQLEIDATDDIGITNYTFKYAGLTKTAADAQETELSILGDTYSASLTPAQLSTLNDSLGIWYSFTFTDAAGKTSDTTGVTYWSYNQNAFSSSNNAVDWHQIGEQSSEQLTISDFNIIAFPFEAQRVNTVIEELSQPNDSVWRLFRHIAGNNNEGFKEFGSSEFSSASNFSPGQAYFMILRNRSGINFGGQVAEMTIQDEATLFPIAHELNLKEGWNLIGNPFPFDISWESVANDPLNSSIKDQLMQLNRLTNTEDDYILSSELNSFEGAFLNWPGADDQKIYISPSARKNNATNRTEQVESKGWELPIVLEQRHLKSTRAGVGMHPEAKEGMDWYDALQVPKPQGQAEFLIENLTYNYNRSVVPQLPNYLWNVQIAGASAGEEIKLSWDRQLLSDLPQGLYLWDETNIRLIDMQEQSFYTFLVPEHGKLPLQIYYGRKNELFKNLDIQRLIVGQPFPNPAMDRIKLPLTIPQGTLDIQNVYVTIYNSQGQEISSSAFNPLVTGYYEMEIDLPEHASSGLYHYMLKVDGKESNTFYGRIIKR